MGSSESSHAAEANAGRSEYRVSAPPTLPKSCCSGACRSCTFSTYASASTTTSTTAAASVAAATTATASPATAATSSAAAAASPSTAAAATTTGKASHGRTAWTKAQGCLECRS
jgi:hypothetical protein